MFYQEHYFDECPIRFYNRDEPYYEFTNFYSAPVLMDGKLWPTTEHYFQAQKFIGTPFTEVIRNFQRPREAFDLSRNPAVSCWRRKDWEEVKVDIMHKALLAKFTQHRDLRQLLLDTQNRRLIEHSPYDNFWGNGGDDRGQNQLGLLLMEVRDNLNRSMRETLFSTQPACAESLDGKSKLLPHPMECSNPKPQDQYCSEQDEGGHRLLSQTDADKNDKDMTTSENGQRPWSPPHNDGDEHEAKQENSKVDSLVIGTSLPDGLLQPLQPVSPAMSSQGISAEAEMTSVPLQLAAGEEATVTNDQTPVMPLHIQPTLPAGTSQGVVPTSTNVPPETAGEPSAIASTSDVRDVLIFNETVSPGSTPQSTVLPNCPTHSSGNHNGIASDVPDMPPHIQAVVSDGAPQVTAATVELQQQASTEESNAMEIASNEEVGEIPSTVGQQSQNVSTDSSPQNIAARDATCSVNEPPFQPVILTESVGVTIATNIIPSDKDEEPEEMEIDLKHPPT